MNRFRTYYHSLDKFLILRGVLCVMIIIYHSLPPRQFLYLGGYDLTWIYFANGAFAVYTFFILSGYLMGKNFFLGKYDLTFARIISFFKARARRIMPLYYFIFLIFALFAYTHLQFPKNWGFDLRVLTFTYTGVGTVHFNNAWWAISSEVEFYLLVPVLFYLIGKLFKYKFFYTLLILIIFLGFSALRLYFHLGSNRSLALENFISFPLVQYFDTFLVAFMLYPLVSFFPRIKQILGRRGIWSIAVFILMYFVTAYLLYQEAFRSNYGNQLYYALLPTLTILGMGLWVILADSAGQPIGIGNRKTDFLSVIKNPGLALEYLGLFSYGVFLWHMGILQTMGTLIVYDGRLYLYFAKTFLTIFWSIILAGITYFVIEKPFLAKKALPK